MNILSIHTGGHDAKAVIANVQQVLAAVQLERLTRIKGDGNRIPHEAIDEVLSIANLQRPDIDVILTSRMGFPALCYKHWPVAKKLEYLARDTLGKGRIKHLSGEMHRTGTINEFDLIDREKVLDHLGFKHSCQLGFYNHHFAHALSALAYTEWTDALLYTSDAGGDNVCWSHSLLRDGAITRLHGKDGDVLTDQPVDSLGFAYGCATMALGYRMARHEGKVTGLAAFGQPVAVGEIGDHFKVDDYGRVTTDFSSLDEMKSKIFSIASRLSREDLAASIQQVLEDKVLESVRALVDRHQVRKLGLAGGVFANVRLNRVLAEQSGVDQVFVFPGMGDEGIAVGGVHQWLIENHGLDQWLEGRSLLRDVYLGKNYDDQIDDHLSQSSLLEKVVGNAADNAATLLESGLVGAIYNGRMEFGPRALGARSIIASPADSTINDELNKRLQRTEFMPFAPYVSEEDAGDVFEVSDVNKYCMRFMTITCEVKEAWREKIPAVVHIDGTARPQIVEREHNPLYADILQAFKQRTGLPVLVNTSFNAHEEPIINKPEECCRALTDRRVDFVVTQKGIYFKKESADAVGTRLGRA